MTTAPERCQKLRSSAGTVLIAAEEDGKTAWVRTGQVYERLALTLTSLQIKSAFLNQPIEVAAVRGQFQRAMGLGPALPQLLVRVGYADAMPCSLRRPVDQAIIEPAEAGSLLFWREKVAHAHDRGTIRHRPIAGAAARRCRGAAE